jgi:hypothetical protein
MPTIRHARFMPRRGQLRRASHFLKLVLFALLVLIFALGTLGGVLTIAKDIHHALNCYL